MTGLPIQAIWLQVLTRLDAARIPSMIMGGFAVRATGVPRPTYDADLTTEAPDTILIHLFDPLLQDGFIVPIPSAKTGGSIPAHSAAASSARVAGKARPLGRSDLRVPTRRSPVPIRSTA